MDWLKRIPWGQIALLLLVLAIAFGVTYAGYYWYSDREVEEDGETDLLVPVRRGNLVNEVSISGSLVYPDRETLSFDVEGVIGELLVQEGDRVSRGQLLARLDRETVSALERAAAKARVDLRDAEQALIDAAAPEPSPTPSPLDFAKAESAIADAEVAYRDAREAFDNLGVITEYDLARAREKVAAEGLALSQAEDDLAETIAGADTDDIADAHSTIRTATTDLDNAERDEELARRDWERRLQAARDDAQDSLDIMGNYYQKWFGVRPDDDDIARGLDDVLASWGTDLESLFDPDSVAPLHRYPAPGATPATSTVPWNENTMLFWLRVYPGNISLTCEEPLPSDTICVRPDFDDEWEVYTEKLSALDDLELEATRALSALDEIVTSASEKLFNSQYALADVLAGPDPVDLEHKRKALELAEEALKVAEQELEDLQSGPDPLDVEAAVADVALKSAALEQAREDLSELRQGEEVEEADPLDLALLQADIEAARIALSGVLADLEAVVLRAPWSGTVSELLTDVGQQIRVGDAVVEMVDHNVVEMSGIVDEIDVLYLREGAAATVRLEALEGQTLAGVVSRIATEPNSQQGVVSYPLDVTLETAPGVQLLEGLSAVASVVIREETDVLLIPLQALHGTFDRPAVRVLGEDGEVELREIILGNSDDFWTVVESGLSEGETLLMQSQDASESFFGFGRGFAGGATRTIVVPAGGRGR